MSRLPRQVSEVTDKNNQANHTQPKPLASYRETHAWILLGEPGAGKSTAMEMEAEAIAGQYLRIDDFIHGTPDPAWQGKTLFLDGLDEIRAGGGSTLIATKKQLQVLNNPPYRIACRAADWYGASDRSDLGRPDIPVLQLEPFSREDKLALLSNPELKIADAQAFMAEAEQRGIAGLLDNPQTLELLAKAIRGDNWPENRSDTYRLACEKLAGEDNKKHRDQRRHKPIMVDTLLEAAGELSAILLFSDQTGIALDRTVANDRFFAYDSITLATPEASSQALGSKLFRPDGEERFVPAHRSIAEYLAASWLAQRIEKGLPLKRVLTHLLGKDGGVVAGLRGLFAWLALHSVKARQALIEADPLTTIVYGDVQPMATEEKRQLLRALRSEGRNFRKFHLREVIGSQALGSLAVIDLLDDFKNILHTPDRDDSSQEMVYFVLEVFSNGQLPPDLAPDFLKIISDESHWPAIRHNALEIWLKLVPSATALALLDDITANLIADENNELAGRLLSALYPLHLKPEELCRHLHAPKSWHIGSHAMFWEFSLAEIAPDEHLPKLLDQLVNHPALDPSTPLSDSLKSMADALVARGITAHGDYISGQRLYDWLGIALGVSDFGITGREETPQQQINNWLNARPERYKALLELCYAQSNMTASLWPHFERFHGAPPPEDFGLWHLEQASKATTQQSVQVHLAEALRTLYANKYCRGLSLELIEAWSHGGQNREELLKPLLTCEIQDWQHEQATRKAIHKKEKTENRLARTTAISPHLTDIPKGTASIALMRDLAAVWNNRFSGVFGKTLEERFANFSENSSALLAASKKGFRLCLARDDLPTVEEIIRLCFENQEHRIRMPCLIGMDLYWEEGIEQIEAIPDETLARMLAFRLTYGCNETPPWFFYLAEHRPVLVAEVLQKFASAAFKSDRDYFEGISLLWHNPACRELAKLTVPNLLDAFPVRARSEQLHDLESLLKTAFRDAPYALPALIEKKLSMQGMDAAQRVYWLAAATLLDPEKNELAMWRYVGTTESKANTLAAFLGQMAQTQLPLIQLPVHTMGKLIEVIAPHAELLHPAGCYWVSPARERGEQIGSWISRIAATPSDEAGEVLASLLSQPSLKELKPQLEQAIYEHRQLQREKSFRFLSPAEAAQIFANQAPTSRGDLLALTVDHLESIGQAIRQDNDDGYRAFWNVENKQKGSQREENLCRDTLLRWLRAALLPYGIMCEPEVDHSGDKRADIQVSYGTDLSLPIEIKRDSHKDLWKSADEQLAKQYLKHPEACGIYLVLWFGDSKSQTAAKDGGKKPLSPDELERRLQAHISPANRKRIRVMVMDVSWPT